MATTFLTSSQSTDIPAGTDLLLSICLMEPQTHQGLQTRLIFTSGTFGMEERIYAACMWAISSLRTALK